MKLNLEQRKIYLRLLENTPQRNSIEEAFDRGMEFSFQLVIDYLDVTFPEAVKLLKKEFE